MPTRAEPTNRPVEVTRHEIAAFLSDLPSPDAALDRLAEELAAAHAALVAESQRASDLRGRQATRAAALATATGATRTGLLQELVIGDADLGTRPAAIAAATGRRVIAHLRYLQRLKALADAEAARLVAETNDPIAAVDRASLNHFKAEGYAGDPQPVLVAGTRAALQDARRAVAPALERYGRAKEAAGMARAAVEATYGADVAGFASGDRATLSWETVAAQAAEQAAERTRRETGVTAGKVAA